MKALRAQTLVELKLTLRRGESLLVTVVIPVGLLLFFSWVHIMPIVSDAPRSQLIERIVAVATIASSMVSLGIATGFERHYGVLKRLGGTPLGRPRLISAKAISILVVELIQLTALLAVGKIIGWNGSIDVVRIAAILMLGTAAFGGIGLLMAGTLRGETNLAMSNGLFLFLILAGGVIVPPSQLPAALSTLDRFLPGWALVSGWHWALGGGNLGASNVAALAAWAVVAPIVAALTFSWE